MNSTPEGVVLTGGGARMREIDKFVRNMLNMSVKIGVPAGLSGVAESTYKPEYATAVGLMLMSASGETTARGKKSHVKTKKDKKPGIIGRLLGKF